MLCVEFLWHNAPINVNIHLDIPGRNLYIPRDHAEPMHIIVRSLSLRSFIFTNLMVRIIPESIASNHSCLNPLYDQSESSVWPVRPLSECPVWLVRPLSEPPVWPVRPLSECVWPVRPLSEPPVWPVRPLLESSMTSQTPARTPWYDQSDPCQNTLYDQSDPCQNALYDQSDPCPNALYD